MATSLAKSFLRKVNFVMGIFLVLGERGSLLLEAYFEFTGIR